ncbi:hypothetical protein ACFX4N_24460 [Priestia sp. YIM B13551]|uniref:hypothetical protein n=1 Tax=Priestia sp. YIM B13551 TaxID=3366306 RepID=UPI0036710F83
MIINGNKEYKEDEFIHFLREDNGEMMEIKISNGKGVRKMHDKREIPFSDIVLTNLNKQGESIPFANNGVINVNRYMFTFWTNVIGPECVHLYYLLNEYCNDETDICFPKESELAQRIGISSPTTLRKKLRLLQENNFILIINRLNKLANNKETSPIYKIRQTIPMLSKEQYNQLPKYLKEKHDDFMQKYGRDLEMDYFLHDSKETIGELLSNSEKIISKKNRAAIDKLIENSEQSDYILNTLTPYEKMSCNQFHKLLQDQWSKPSYEMIFNDSICIYNEDIGGVDLILNEAAKDIVKETAHYTDRLISICSSIFDEEIEIINYYNFKEYMIKLERAK